MRVELCRDEGLRPFMRGRHRWRYSDAAWLRKRLIVMAELAPGMTMKGRIVYQIACRPMVMKPEIGGKQEAAIRRLMTKRRPISGHSNMMTR